MVRKSLSGCVIRHSTSSAGCSSTGASSVWPSSGATVTWSLWPCVHTTATTLRPVDGVDDRRRGVGGVEHDDVGVVADQPDVVVDFPTAAVEFEGPVGDHPCRSQHHHRAQHLAAVHLVEGLLDVAEPDAFGDELVQRQAGPAGRGRSGWGSRARAGSRRTTTTSATRRGRRSPPAACRGACRASAPPPARRFRPGRVRRRPVSRFRAGRRRRSPRRRRTRR